MSPHSFPSQCPLSVSPQVFSCMDHCRCPVPAVAEGPVEPHGPSVPWAHPGGARAACPSPPALPAGSGGSCALAFSVSWSYHFCFLDRKQNKTQAIAAPAQINQVGFISPAFSISLLSGSVPLHSSDNRAEAPQQSSFFSVFATC